MPMNTLLVPQKLSVLCDFYKLLFEKAVSSLPAADLSWTKCFIRPLFRAVAIVMDMSLQWIINVRKYNVFI